MNAPELRDALQFLAETPRIVEEAAAGLTPDDLRWRPSAKEWSVLENVCHLRDIESEGYRVRIRRLLEEEHPYLADLDGSRLAEERRYNTQDAPEGIAGFRRSREETLQALGRVAPEQWDRSGTFETTGTITLRDLVGMMREHDQAHRTDLARLREQLQSRRP